MHITVGGSLDTTYKVEVAFCAQWCCMLVKLIDYGNFSSQHQSCFDDEVLPLLWINHYEKKNSICVLRSKDAFVCLTNF